MQQRCLLAAVALGLTLTAAAPALGAGTTHAIHLPADEAMHPNAATEWRDVVGLLTDDSGHTYGFETSAIKLSGLRRYIPASPLNTIYRSDVAITDETAGRFYGGMRYTASLLGTGASTTHLNVNVGGISLRTVGSNGYALTGHTTDGNTISLTLAPDRPVLLVGGGYIAWGNSGDVSFELEQHGDEVMLTLIHRRLPDRRTLLMVAAGWHASRASAPVRCTCLR